MTPQVASSLMVAYSIPEGSSRFVLHRWYPDDSSNACLIDRISLHGQHGSDLLFIEVLPLTIMGLPVLVFLFRYTVH